MAYHCLHTNIFTGYEEALSFISTSLQTIGWTLYDDISSTNKVFTSTGEDNQFVNAYIRIFISTYLRFEGYMWWNSDTNTGTGKAYTNTSYNYMKPEDNNSLIVYGNKDVIMIWSAVGASNSNYSSIAFGYLNPFIEGYTTASGIYSGSNVLIDVDSTSNLINGSYAKIIGTETEGRDTVYITSIENETQFRVTSTPRDYVSGAKIGIYPCTFFVTSATYGIQYVDLKYVCGYLSSSTSNASTSHEYQSVGELFSMLSYIDPESYTNRYIIQPQGFGDTFSPYPMVGTMKEFKMGPVSRTTDVGYDTYLYCAGENPVNSSPTASTVSGIIDSGQSWEVDEFVDKIIVITSGPGTGQTRNILSNTSDILNIGDLWDNVPSVDSTYEIHEIVYRNLYSNVCAREIVS